MSLKCIAALIVVLSLMMCLCACGDDGNTNITTVPTIVATEPTTEATEPADEVVDPTYVVKVVDQDNVPVAGAFVQLCLEACVPAITDENGVANFFLEEANYKVGFTVMPAGYEYANEEQEWYFADGENTMTIVIKKSA